MSNCFHLTENPTVQGVYEVLITINGVQHPRHNNEPKLYAFYDGIDTWHCWEFSVRRAEWSPKSTLPKGHVLPWREVTKNPTYLTD